MLEILDAQPSDREAIRTICLSAFPEEERDSVAQLAVDLLDTAQNPGAFSLLATVDGEAVGHVAFSPVVLDTDQEWSGYILAPLGVKPVAQKGRVGCRLVEAGIERLRGKGVTLVFVYGDPAYYGRFGFDAGVADAYIAPYDLEYPFGWQAVVLAESGDPVGGGQLRCVPALMAPGLW